MVVDHFETTPNLATFSLGFVISQFEGVCDTLKDEENLMALQQMEGHSKQLEIQIYSRKEFVSSLAGIYDKVFRIQRILKRYLASAYPAKQLKIVALPNVAMVRPADSFGLIVLRWAIRKRITTGNRITTSLSLAPVQRKRSSG